MLRQKVGKQATALASKSKYTGRTNILRLAIVTKGRSAATVEKTSTLKARHASSCHSKNAVSRRICDARASAMYASASKADATSTVTCHGSMVSPNV